MARNALIQINADDIVGFEFVWNGAVPYAGNHDCEAFAFLDEIFGADRVKETLTDSDIAKLDTAAGRLRSHAGGFHHALGRQLYPVYLHFERFA